MTFSGTTTGVIARGFDLVFLGCNWENADVGINSESVTGSLTVIDSGGANVKSLITAAQSSSPGNSIILDNIHNEGGTTVTAGGKRVLTNSVSDTWVHGDLV